MMPTGKTIGPMAGPEPLHKSVAVRGLAYVIKALLGMVSTRHT